MLLTGGFLAEIHARCQTICYVSETESVSGPAMFRNKKMHEGNVSGQ